jgi:hypothetical protein
MKLRESGHLFERVSNWVLVRHGIPCRRNNKASEDASKDKKKKPVSFLDISETQVISTTAPTARTRRRRQQGDSSRAYDDATDESAKPSQPKPWRPDPQEKGRREPPASPREERGGKLRRKSKTALPVMKLKGII